MSRFLGSGIFYCKQHFMELSMIVFIFAFSDVNLHYSLKLLFNEL